MTFLRRAPRTDLHRSAGLRIATLLGAVALVACGADDEVGGGSLRAADRGAPATETLKWDAGGEKSGKGASPAEKRGRKAEQDPDLAEPLPGADASETDENRPSGSSKEDSSDGGRKGTGSRPHSPGDRRTPKTRMTSVSDPRGDLEGEGDAPAFADVTQATLEMTGGLLSVSFDLAGRLPARMSGSETATVIGIDIAAGRANLSVYAEGSANGWRLRSNRGTDDIDLSIEGRRASFDIPTSLFGNARRFNWDGYSSWTKSTFTETEYYFDQAPDLPPARFPAR